MLFNNHVFLDWLDFEISVKDDTNQKVKNKNKQKEALGKPKGRHELNICKFTKYRVIFNFWFSDDLYLKVTVQSQEIS